MARPRTLSEAAIELQEGAVSGRPVTQLWRAVQSIPVETPYCVSSHRHDSLGARGRRRIFAALCTFSLGLALTFAAFGAWLVLPYSVLEMVVLFLAFSWIGRHAEDWERLRVDGDQVIVEHKRGGAMSRHEFNRCWTRLEADRGHSGRLRRLALCSAGKRVTIGDDLSTAERTAVEKNLRRALAAR